MHQDTLILQLWDGRLATWTGRWAGDCLYVKILGARWRIWIPRALVLQAGRASNVAA